MKRTSWNYSYWECTIKGNFSKKGSKGPQYQEIPFRLPQRDFLPVSGLQRLIGEEGGEPARANGWLGLKGYKRGGNRSGLRRLRKIKGGDREKNFEKQARRA